MENPTFSYQELCTIVGKLYLEKTSLEQNIYDLNDKLQELTIRESQQSTN